MIEHLLPTRLRTLYLRVKKYSVERWFPDWAYARRKQSWVTRWAGDDFLPFWMTHSVPKELEEAVRTGWLPKGARIVDVGCGDGDIDAWLAAQGHEVVGVDLAPGAVEKARKKHAGVPGLTFEVVDIVQDPLPAARYQAVFDRGCFHVIPDTHRAGYVENVARATVPGAKVLLLHATFDHPEKVYKALPKDAVVRRVREAFEPHFTVDRITDISLHVRSDQPMPAVAFWMTKP